MKLLTLLISAAFIACSDTNTEKQTTVINDSNTVNVTVTESQDSVTMAPAVINIEPQPEKEQTTVKVTKETVIKDPVVTKPKETTKPKTNNNNARFIVSFFSPGDGTDYKMREEYKSFVAAYNPNVTYETRQWGREGEVDFCFKLSGLSSSQQEKFISDSKSLLSKSKKVNYKENAPCRTGG